MSTPRHIVVAEDDRATRLLLERYLRGAGYEVVACADGRAALDAIQRLGSGIVLADWMMPELTGPELCREIRQRSEAGQLGFVFFLLLTAQREADQVLAGFEAGADDYLTKPYNRNELLARLRAGERIYRLQSELFEANRQLSQIKDEFEQMAKTDALTQIANRRHLFERLNEEWSYRERTDGRLGVIMFDIDHFKHVNDTHGHHAGDAVLKMIARETARSVRTHDLLGRLGGEEFLVIVRDVDDAGLELLSERLRRCVAEQVVRFEGVEISVTVSVGAAARTPDHAETDDLLADADLALYRAKEAGRNQSWLALPDNHARRIEVSLTPTP